MYDLFSPVGNFQNKNRSAYDELVQLLLCWPDTGKDVGCEFCLIYATELGN